MSDVVSGRNLMRAWAEALNLPESTYRIVIDADLHSAVRVYVCTWGTDKMLEITPPPDLKILIDGVKQ